MATLAFCGLGRMGMPMATRLLESGHDLVVWNRSPDRVTELVDRGARQAESPADAASSADAVVTMLSTPAVVESVVVTGDRPVTAGLQAGATLIEMSTIGPDAVRRIAERLPDGVGMLDAPVLGSVAQATDGSLEVFVGGSEEAFERWRPVLAVLGRPVRHGHLGSGAAMKLVANSTLGAAMSAVGEALALADRLGLDQALVLDALAGSPLGATVKSKRSKIESGDYEANFALELAAKDMRLVEEAARGVGLDARVVTAARAHFDDANRAGLAGLDYSAVIAHVREGPE